MPSMGEEDKKQMQREENIVRKREIGWQVRRGRERQVQCTCFLFLPFSYEGRGEKVMRMPHRVWHKCPSFSSLPILQAKMS